MIRQYYAHRRQGGANPLGVGTIAANSIYYLQDEGYFRSRYGEAPVCRNPWIVEAFLNGLYTAARRDPATGKWSGVHISGRSDTAVVRSLRDGRRRTVTVHTLQVHDELGLSRGPQRYPSKPDLRLYRRGTRQVVGANSGEDASAPREIPRTKPLPRRRTQVTSAAA